jgi:hypothetical protein
LVTNFWPISARSEIISDPTEICKVAKSGRLGAWLDTAALTKCFEAEKNVASLTLEVGNLRLQIESFNKSLILMTDSNFKAHEQILKLTGQTRLAEDLAMKFENDLKRWYHNPWIVGSIGVLVGGLSVSAIVIATH